MHSTEEVFIPIAYMFKKERGNMLRMLVCKLCKECAILDQLFETILQEEFTEQLGVPIFLITDSLICMSATDKKFHCDILL